MDELELHVVYDEDGEETPYFIDSLQDEYFTAFVIEDDEPIAIARIRNWNNHMASYEDLDSGVLYDALDYLCDKVTDYRYR